MDPPEPLLGARTRPARNHEPQRCAVHRMERAAVLGEGDEHVVRHRLGDRYTTRDGELARLSGEVRIGADVRGVDDAGLHTRRLQYVPEPNTRPLRAGDRAVGPLVALRRRIEKSSSVAAAFDGQRHRDDFELRSEIGDRKIRRAVDEAVHGEGPGVGIHFGGRYPVVADEMASGRSNRIVQQMRRGLGVDRTIVQQRQPVLPDQYVLVRESGRDEPCRHVPVEWNRRSHHCRHGGESCSPQKAAPIGARLPPEEGAIRRQGVRGEEFMEIPGFRGRGLVR